MIHAFFYTVIDTLMCIAIGIGIVGFLVIPTTSKIRGLRSHQLAAMALLGVGLFIIWYEFTCGSWIAGPMTLGAMVTAMILAYIFRSCFGSTRKHRSGE